ncbi:glycosyltransferase family 4 protein [Robertkochia solimangrovi]|uniref:glycosyltransferase family 4 protein n=1 Tax=Robertkochia solimangrovi TaxID=2213046 RepID=UPI00117D9C68|nr:glycosyltransferase [Robertkochia solimangrovi]TRZ45014.1 hypothetical protein DMZ48_04430 [Robertkochia solimangrovi]
MNAQKFIKTLPLRIDKQINLAIIYHYFAHYRLPVLEELSHAEMLNITLLGDQKSDTDIPTIDPDGELSHLHWYSLKNHWLLGGKLLWQGNLLRYCISSKDDIFIFLGSAYYITTWLAMFILKIRRKPVLLWTHGVTNDQDGFNWKLRSFFYGISNGVLLYGNKAKEVMAGKGYPTSELHVIYNSVDHKKQVEYRNRYNPSVTKAIRAEFFENPGDPLLIFIGRLTPQKKLQMLPEVIRKLKDQGESFNLLLVGDGPERSNLTEQVDALDLSAQIKFYGACYDEIRVSELVQAADMCISPGEVGLTAITALGYGTPVITHDDFNHQMPEYEAIVSGYNGMFFERDNMTALADQLITWKDITKDMSKDEIRTRCFNRIDKYYNPSYQATTITEIIQSQLKNNA